MESLESRGPSTPDAQDPAGEPEQQTTEEAVALPQIAPFETALDSLSSEDREFWMRHFATC